MASDIRPITILRVKTPCYPARESNSFLYEVANLYGHRSILARCLVEKVIRLVLLSEMTYNGSKIKVLDILEVFDYTFNEAPNSGARRGNPHLLKM